MKTKLKYIAVVLLAILLGSCNKEKVLSTCNVFVIDKTNPNYDKDVVFPNTADIDTYFKNTVPGNARIFWITEISEVSMNSINKFNLPQVSIWDNPHNRKDSLVSFYGKVDCAMNEVLSDFGEKAESSIYLSLCHLFSSIRNIDADEKNVLLFSDLLENSSMTLSFYKRPPSERNYKKILEKFESVAKMPDLTGINIVLVYKPTKKSDKLFYHAKHFWKRLVNEKGGTITFIANF